LLGPMSKKAQQSALKVLSGFGVHIELETTVKDYQDGNVVMANGQTIPTDTLIWASGVIAREVPGIAQEQLGRGRRILVDENNKVKSSENIFAIGDLCFQTT